MASASDEKLEARYKVAKERCEALSGDAREACLRDARARYHQYFAAPSRAGLGIESGVLFVVTEI